MRLGKIVEAWIRLSKSNIGKLFPRSVDLPGGLGIPTNIVLPAAVTVIFGLNGTGKTRVLRQIAESDENGRFVGLHELIDYLMTELSRRDDLQGLIEDTAQMPLDDGVLSSIHDLVRREYDEVRWYSVALEESPFRDIVGDDVVPVFVVKYGDVDYDFRQMGLGELSVHLLLWIIAYTRESSDLTLMFDEPEAYMPSRSRSVLLHHLLVTALSQQRSMVIASHSLELVNEALRADAGLLLSETRNIVKFIGPSAELADQVAGMYGRDAVMEKLIYCEDEAAFALGRELFRLKLPLRSQSMGFLWCSGFGDLQMLWEHVPRPANHPEGVVEFLFLADGDKLKTVSELIAKHSTERKWPFVCLPDDPDVLFRKYSQRAVAILAPALGLADSNLDGLLESLKGREAHNWTEDVLSASQVNRESTFSALARAVAPFVTDDFEIPEDF